MPTKKKQLTEEQMVKLMTRRRNCIQKYRKSHKNKSISFSNPLVQEIPKKSKKRVNNKKVEEPIEATDVEPIIQIKKKRTYKKKVEEPEPIIYTD